MSQRTRKGNRDRKAGSGIRQAIVATAHKILIIAYQVLREGTSYQELGGGYFDQLHPEHASNRLLRRLAEVRRGLADLSDFSASLRDNFFACNGGF